MIRLAIPGMIMIEAEYLAFEILTLASSRFGPEALAAQSILATLASVAYQLPFALSIAASTRIANLIGAGLVPAAVTSTQVVCAFSLPLLSASPPPPTSSFHQLPVHLLPLHRFHLGPKTLTPTRPSSSPSSSASSTQP